MVALVIVTHGGLAQALVSVAEGIVGPVERCAALGFDPKQPVEAWTSSIVSTMQRLDDGDGILFLVDMFGGSPCNVSLRQLGEHAIEVVTGVNLPMILGVCSAREGQSLAALASEAREAGVGGVVVATDILRSRLAR